MILKELVMVEYLFLKIYWNKILIAILLFLCFFACIGREKQVAEFESQYCDTTLSTSPSFIGVKLKFMDSIYYTVLPEYEITIFPKYKYMVSQVKREQIYQILRGDTISIDYDMFKYFRSNRCLVLPIKKVHTVYDGDLHNLLSCYIDENGVLRESLSIEERTYVIYLLFLNRIYVYRDCETGSICVINSILSAVP